MAEGSRLVSLDLQNHLKAAKKAAEKLQAAKDNFKEAEAKYAMPEGMSESEDLRATYQMNLRANLQANFAAEQEEVRAW